MSAAAKPNLGSGKITSARIYELRQDGSATRNNETPFIPLDIYEGIEKIRQAFVEFGKCPVRRRLVLILDNGLEIGVMPTLKVDVPALGEPGAEAYSHTLADWEISCDIWPLR